MALPAGKRNDTTVTALLREQVLWADGTPFVLSAIDDNRLLILRWPISLREKHTMGCAAGKQAKAHERKEPKNTKAKDNLLSKCGTGAVTVKCVMRAAETFVRRDKPLIGSDGSGDGKARNHVASNVQIEGLAATKLGRSPESSKSYKP